MTLWCYTNAFILLIIINQIFYLFITKLPSWQIAVCKQTVTLSKKGMNGNRNSGSVWQFLTSK